MQNDAPLMVADATMNINNDNGANEVNTDIRFHIGDGLFVFVEPEAVRLCGLIVDRGGVFARCHSKVAPAFFYQSCLQDTCLDQGAQDTICNWLQIYASTCQTQGVPLTGWRSDTPCGEFTLILPCTLIVCAVVSPSITRKPSHLFLLISTHADNFSFRALLLRIVHRIHYKLYNIYTVYYIGTTYYYILLNIHLKLTLLNVCNFSGK